MVLISNDLLQLYFIVIDKHLRLLSKDLIVIKEYITIVLISFMKDFLPFTTDSKVVDVAFCISVQID